MDKKLKARSLAVFFWLCFNGAMIYTLNVAGQRHDYLATTLFGFATGVCNLVMGYYATKID
jgi:hypothetical protein